MTLQLDTISLNDQSRIDIWLRAQAIYNSVQQRLLLFTLRPRLVLIEEFCLRPSVNGRFTTKE